MARPVLDAGRAGGCSLSLLVCSSSRFSGLEPGSPSRARGLGMRVGEEGALVGVWPREGIGPGCEAIPGPCFAATSYPYLPSPADRWGNSTLSHWGLPMGIPEEAWSCAHPPPPPGCRPDRGPGAQPPRGFCGHRVRSAGKFQKARGFGSWLPREQWAVARGPRVWSSCWGHLPPTRHQSPFDLKLGSSASPVGALDLSTPLEGTDGVSLLPPASRPPMACLLSPL